MGSCDALRTQVIMTLESKVVLNGMDGTLPILWDTDNVLNDAAGSQLLWMLFELGFWLDDFMQASGRHLRHRAATCDEAPSLTMSACDGQRV